MRHIMRNQFTFGKWGVLNFKQYDLGVAGSGLYEDAQLLAPHEIRRRYFGSGNRITSYFTGVQVIPDSQTEDVAFGRMCPSEGQVLDYITQRFGAAVIDDDEYTPYCHSASPYGPANRIVAYEGSGSFWPRHGSEFYLDFLFGSADGSGIDANGNSCWFKTHYIDKIEYLSWIFHDNAIMLWPAALTPAAIDTGYTTYGESQDNWYRYLYAFKHRILIPNNLKVILNLGSWVFSSYGDYTPYQIMDLADGVFIEDFISEADQNGTRLPFEDSFNFDLYTFLLFVQRMAENGKVVGVNCKERAAGSSYYYSNHAVQATYSGLGAAATIVIADNLATVAVDADTIPYTLSDHTITSLAAAIHADFAGITFDYPAGCFWADANETPAEILLNASYNLKTAARILTFRTPPRAAHILMASQLALAGGPAAECYGHYFDYYNGQCSSDMALIFEKLGALDMVAQGYSTVTTHTVSHDDLWADGADIDVGLTGIKYRVYENGVAFYNANTSGGAVTINCDGYTPAAPWEVAAWYNMGNDANICDAGTVVGDLTDSTTVSLAQEKGTICLFGWS